MYGFIRACGGVCKIGKNDNNKFSLFRWFDHFGRFHLVNQLALDHHFFRLFFINLFSKFILNSF